MGGSAGEKELKLIFAYIRMSVPEGALILFYDARTDFCKLLFFIGIAPAFIVCGNRCTYVKKTARQKPCGRRIL